MAALPPSAASWGYRGPQDDEAWNHYINQWRREPSGNYIFVPHTGSFGSSSRVMRGGWDLQPPITQAAPESPQAARDMNRPQQQPQQQQTPTTQTNRGNTNTYRRFRGGLVSRIDRGGLEDQDLQGMQPGTYNPYEMPDLTLPDLSGIDYGGHGRLALRETRKRTNTLLDMLVNRPREYNRANESLGGGLSQLLFRNQNREGLTSNLYNQSLTGGVR